jgi:thioredoxin-dependent peroxiredoxin
VILGASFDTVQENAAFADKFDFPYRLLCDTDRSIGMAYGACDSPEDVYAKRISYVIGPDGIIRHAFPKVDAKSHPRQVLDLLEEAQRP